MDNNRAAIAALLFILLVLLVNFVMYGIVRGATRGGTRSPLETLGQAFNAAKEKKEDAMEELRRRVGDLDKKD